MAKLQEKMNELSGNAQQPTMQPTQMGNGGVVSDPTLDAMALVLMNRNKDKNFVQRALDPSQSIDNGDGTTSTHKMGYAQVDGGYIVYPTIVQQEDGTLKDLGKDATNYAIQNKQAIFTPDEKLAAYIANGGYKTAANKLSGQNNFANGGRIMYGYGGGDIFRSSNGTSNASTWNNFGNNPEFEQTYTGPMATLISGDPVNPIAYQNMTQFTVGAPGSKVATPTGRTAAGYTLPTGLSEYDIEDFQNYAKSKGADLGKTGVDNVYGTKTKAAWDTYGQEYTYAKALAALQQQQPQAQAQQQPATPNVAAAGNTPTDNRLVGQAAYDRDYAQAMKEHEARLAANEQLAQQQHVRERNMMIGAGSLLNSAGDIYGLYQGIKGPDDITLDRLNPDLINLAKQREIARRNAAGSQAVLREGLRAFGKNSGAGLSNLVAGNAAIDQNLANILTQSALDEEVRNTGILNAAQQANQGIDTQEQILNMQAQAKAQEAIQAGLSGIGANAAQGLKDVRQSNAVDVKNEQQLNSMNAILQNFMINKRGEIVFKNGDPASQEDIDAILYPDKNKKKGK